jgi:acyl-CoA hydrolase
MSRTAPERFESVEACVDHVLATVGKHIVLGLPLGLGKPNQFVNELYRRAREDRDLELTICTALSLERPTWSSDLERRFLEPFVERMFGGYIDLDYMLDMRKHRLPPNVQIKEFYCKAGSNIGLGHAQRNYVSSNYTHVWRDLMDQGVNVLAQMVCRAEVDGQPRLSLSSNPDVTLDVSRELRRRNQTEGLPMAIVGQVNQNLPFMYGDAVVEDSQFTALIENPTYDFRLFGAPKMAVTGTDYAIGLAASSLIKDGGTLQIGIGSLGDALVHGLILRQDNNPVYRQVLERAGLMSRFGECIAAVGGTEPFEQGLNGCTEMLVDGYLHLIRAGVVRRMTYDDLHIQRLLNHGRIREQVGPETLEAVLSDGAVRPQLTRADFDWLQRFGILKAECRFCDGKIEIGSERIPADLAVRENWQRVVAECLGDELRQGVLIHGGFFLGPESFYRELREMPDAERRRIHMTSVLRVNQLYEGHYASEELKTLQRPHGRFVNACLMVTLSGAVCSDGLDSGQMVSGVGGQYNFVSQAHALPGGRSILMCKATRTKGKEVHSNVVFNYGHLTIPRHLRDLVITEYGIADLRGKSDKDIIAALLNITDSRFQDDLLRHAKEAGKIQADYLIPERFRDNLPQRLEDDLAELRRQGVFPAFPFGTDFTPDELIIGKALRGLKARMSAGLAKVSGLGRAMTTSVPAEAEPYLQRLQLAEPANSKERMMRKLVVYALKLSGAIQSKGA